MSELSRIREKRNLILEIARIHGIKDIKIFGSVARMDENKNSDVDFIVTFEEGRSLFDLIRFRDEAEKILEKSIDVITEKSLHTSIKENVMLEAVEL